MPDPSPALWTSTVFILDARQRNRNRFPTCHVRNVRWTFPRSNSNALPSLLVVLWLLSIFFPPSVSIPSFHLSRRSTPAKNHFPDWKVFTAPNLAAGVRHIKLNDLYLRALMWRIFSTHILLINTRKRRNFPESSLFKPSLPSCWRNGQKSLVSFSFSTVILFHILQL